MKHFVLWLWALIGIWILMVFTFLTLEWFKHGATWQGASDAITRHVNQSCLLEDVQICGKEMRKKRK